MAGRCEGKIVLMTGAARGEGRSHAAVLASNCADTAAPNLYGPVTSVAYPLSTPADLMH
jgi:(+)-trans-carveol dehydrogenase